MDTSRLELHRGGDGGGHAVGGAHILLTGATGFLGKVVLYELLRRRSELGIERIELAIRPRNKCSPVQRFREEIQASPALARLPAGWTSHVGVVSASLSDDGAGIQADRRDLLASRLTHIVHCAASVEFHLPIRRAVRSNVTAALHVLDLARECPHLQCMVDVSTAYVSPHLDDDAAVEERPVPIAVPAETLYESILAGQYDGADRQAALLGSTRHPNTYTLTKCLSEHLLAANRDGVPLVFVRPSIISASARYPFRGWIDSPAAYSVFVMGIATGQMRAIPARPDTRIDIVPVDIVAERIVDAAFRAGAEARMAAMPPIRHAVVGYERSPTLAQCRDCIVDFFSRNPVGGRSGPAARVPFVRSGGLRHRLHRWHHHRRSPEAMAMADRVETTHRRFAYFTGNTFRFQSSVPFREARWDAESYLHTICQGVSRHLLQRDDTSVVLAGRSDRAPAAGLRWVLRRPDGNLATRVGAYLVSKLLGRVADRVTVDLESFRTALGVAPPGSIQVVAPSYRSHLDPVLISYLCFARPDIGLSLPYVAVASGFARLPLIGWLIKRVRSFYVEQEMGREEKALTSRVQDLVRRGAALELYLEGRRSPTRRFRTPRRGLLRSLQATGATAALFPVAISYDRLPEEEAVVEELEGGVRRALRGRELGAWLWNAIRGRIEVGRIHIACGQPVILDLSADVHDVGPQVIAELQGAMVVTTTHLRAFLAANSLHGVDLDWLCEAVTRRGGRVVEVDALSVDVHPAVERCMREHFLHLFYPEAAVVYAGTPAIAAHIRRNQWLESPDRDPVAALADERVAAVVDALFEPILRDHLRVLDALARVWGEGDARVPTPSELVASMREAHLADLEEAYRDLVERQMLVSDREGRGFVWGMRIDELAVFAEACRQRVPGSRRSEGAVGSRTSELLGR